jgi:hypothetical protein
MPSSLLKVNWHFGGINRLCLPPAFMPVSCSAYSVTLKMEAICSSETSVDFQQTTRHYIPEYSTLQGTFLIEWATFNFSKKDCNMAVVTFAYSHVWIVSLWVLNAIDYHLNEFHPPHNAEICGVWTINLCSITGGSSFSHHLFKNLSTIPKNSNTRMKQSDTSQIFIH